MHYMDQKRRRDGAVVRALASHQCGPGSIPGLGVICGLSLLLVLGLAPRGFSLGTPVFPSPQKPTFPNSKHFIVSLWLERLCKHYTITLLSLEINYKSRQNTHLMASGNCALVTRNEEISCPWRILTNSFILGYIMGSPTTQQTINLSDKLNKAFTAGEQAICMYFFSLYMSVLCLPTRESAQCLIFIPSSNRSGLTPGTPKNRDK